MSLHKRFYQFALIPLLCLFLLSSQGCKDDETATGPVINLTPPNALTAELLPAGYIKLSWKNRSSNETGFLLERKTLNTQYQVVASIAAGLMTFTDSTTKFADSTFVYRLRAYTNASYGAFSDTVAIAVPLTPPSSVQLANQTDSTITINWTDNSTIRTGYIIERKIGANPYTTIGEVKVPITSFTDTATLVGETPYEYRVKSTGPGMIGSPSVPLTVTTGFLAPSNLNAVFQADSAVVLTWTDNTVSESQFVLEYKDTARNATWTQILLPANTVTTSISRTFVVNADYSFRIFSKGKKRTSQVSPIVSAKAAFIAPSFFTVTGVAPNNITMNWTDNSSFESSFEVERKSPTGNFIRISLNIGPNTTSYTDTTTLLAASTYQYRVRAKSLKGNYTPYSNIDSARTPSAEKLVVTVIKNGTALQISSLGKILTCSLQREDIETGAVITIQLTNSNSVYQLPAEMLTKKYRWTAYGAVSGKNIIKSNTVSTAKQ